MSRKARVIQNEDPTSAGDVDLGWLFKGLIIAGAIGAFTAILGLPTLGYRVASGEEQDESFVADIARVDADIARAKRNQYELDTNQRILMQESEWTQDKLDALLVANGVTERIKRPPLPKSSLEKPPTASATE